MFLKRLSFYLNFKLVFLIFEKYDRFVAKFIRNIKKKFIIYKNYRNLITGENIQNKK